MKFVRKHKNFSEGSVVRVINIESFREFSRRKPAAYVNFEYDVTTYDIEIDDNVSVATGIKNGVEHASWFFRNNDLRKVETIMDARELMDIEKVLESLNNHTWEELIVKHRGSTKGKKYGI